MALAAGRLHGHCLRAPAPAWLAPTSARQSTLTRAVTSGAATDETPVVLFTAEQVQASLRMRDPAAAPPPEPATRNRRPRGTSPAAVERKAKMEGLRNAALQSTGLSERDFKARLKALRKLVPGLKEERLLQLQPAELCELFSDEGASAAAARLVQLQSQHADLGVLHLLHQLPELLTVRGQRSILLGHTSAPKAMVFAQQGSVLVSLDHGAPQARGALKVWDMQGSRSCTTVPPASRCDSLQSVVAHPDGRHVLVGGIRIAPLGGSGGPVRQPLLCVLDLQTQRWVAESSQTEGVGPGCDALAVVPGLKAHLVLSLTSAAGAVAWELGVGADGIPTLKHQGPLPGMDAVKPFAYRSLVTVPGTQSVLAAGMRLRRWSDLGSARPTLTEYYIARRRHQHARGLAVSPDGRLAVTCHFERSLIRVWDLHGVASQGPTSPAAPPQPAILDSGGSVVDCLAISPDSQYAVAGDRKGTLTVWDLQALRRVATVERAHSGAVCSLVFDGRQLLSGGYDCLLRLWDWDEVLAGKARG